MMKISQTDREDLNLLYKRLGMNIKKLRQARGYSQEKLAFEANVARAHMGKVERGDGVSIATLLKLAKILGVEITDIFKIS